MVVGGEAWRSGESWGRFAAEAAVTGLRSLLSVPHELESKEIGHF